MQSPFANCYKAEVFDDVRHVYFFAPNARFMQCFIEQLPRRSDEWTAFLVLGIARLLAHH